jgi:hypothetical protein
MRLIRPDTDRYVPTVARQCATIQKLLGDQLTELHPVVEGVVFDWASDIMSMILDKFDWASDIIRVIMGIPVASARGYQIVLGIKLVHEYFPVSGTIARAAGDMKSMWIHADIHARFLQWAAGVHPNVLDTRAAEFAISFQHTGNLGSTIPPSETLESITGQYQRALSRVHQGAWSPRDVQDFVACSELITRGVFSIWSNLPPEKSRLIPDQAGVQA